jgi:hypothetical protein
MSEASRKAAAVRSRLGAVVRAARGTTPPGVVADPTVAALVESVLFDHEWYSLCARRRMDREDAARHYLTTGWEQGLTPHPLILPEFLAAQDPSLEG